MAKQDQSRFDSPRHLTSHYLSFSSPTFLSLSFRFLCMIYFNLSLHALLFFHVILDDLLHSPFACSSLFLSPILDVLLVSPPFLRVLLTQVKNDHKKPCSQPKGNSSMSLHAQEYQLKKTHLRISSYIRPLSSGFLADEALVR